jgi:hypothetical protein
MDEMLDPHMAKAAGKRRDRVTLPIKLESFIKCITQIKYL